MEEENGTGIELTEKRRFIHSLVFPTFILLIFWLVRISESVLQIDLSFLGVYPLTLKGVPGIFLAPFIHGSFNHLINNSIPFFVLSVAIFYFYRGISYRIFFLVWIITGIWVWVSAREAYHIGASGLIYGFASFLFFSGVIRNDIRLLAISLLVTFLYGSMIWGVLPLKPQISWESHLSGGIAGLVLAIIYRKQGPEKITFSWDSEPENLPEDPEEDEEYQDILPENNPDPEKTPEKRNNPYLKIVYKYKGNDKNSDDSGVLPDKNNQVN
ncbi:MAG TPA: rhomboid family intramembrane serine protease [Bacteroidales bacterium]|nr:rhomboid family intramembrane serine protease [Bacteroidales bacterium]